MLYVSITGELGLKKPDFKWFDGSEGISREIVARRFYQGDTGRFWGGGGRGGVRGGEVRGGRNW